MQEYLDKVRHVQSCFNNFTLRQIPRGQNSHADSLAILATSLGSNLPRVIIVEDLVAPSRNDQPLGYIAYRLGRVGWTLWFHS